jgi:hypothetical protein
MLLQLASAGSRIRMATPLESLHRLHSGRVQHSVITATASLEECADGGITAQPTSIKLGWRKDTQSACGHVATSVPAPAWRCTWDVAWSEAGQ